MNKKRHVNPLKNTFGLWKKSKSVEVDNEVPIEDTSLTFILNGREICILTNRRERILELSEKILILGGNIAKSPSKLQYSLRLFFKVLIHSFLFVIRQAFK